MANETNETNEATVRFDSLYVLASNEMSMCDRQDDRYWGAAWAYYRVAYDLFGNDRALKISRMIWDVADEKKLSF